MPKVVPALAACLALLAPAACSGDGGPTATPPTSPTSLADPGQPSTTGPPNVVSPVPEGVRAALLVPEDVPGSKLAAGEAKDFDFSACFPGNPLAAAADPTEAESPDLEVNDGGVRRNFASSVRQGTPDQAEEIVDGFASAAGSACVVDALKQAISSGPQASRVEGSALAGTGRAAPIAEGGAVLSIAGELTSGAEKAPAAFDLVVFRKGALLVTVALGAIGGPAVPAQAVQLAEKIAGRLP